MFPQLTGEIGPRMTFNGKEMLNWSLNNYLGLANHPEVRKADAEGAKEFGIRHEMKNMNSFRSIVRAIDYEAGRQIEELEAGNKIVQETLRWDDVSGKTFSMRDKEDAQDYRYFPDPDLIPVRISRDLVDNLSTKRVAELYQDAVNCLHCLLYEYCDCEHCIETIQTYIEKGVKGLNDNTSEQL